VFNHKEDDASDVPDYDHDANNVEKDDVGLNLEINEEGA